MPPASPSPWTAVEELAVRFSKAWAGASSEKSESRDFVRAFLAVFGRTEAVGTFESKVKTADGRTNFIDFFWKGRIAIEMKSRGKSLDDAWAQLAAYMALLPPGEIPDLWMVSDFRTIHIRHVSAGQGVEFPASKLKKYVRHFAALAGIEAESIRADKESVNVQAAGMMARLHEALKGHGYAGDDLQAYTARLLFCLFADDTGIFPQDSFFRYVEESREDGSDLNALLAELFQALDEPPEQGRAGDARMAHFRYINGGLFKGRLRRAVFDRKMRKTLLDCLSFDWGQISPAIFGSMFQAAMEGAERRELGAHYTSEENILKLIDPLFMDALRAEFSEAKKVGYQALAALHDKLSGLKFLDPACGCGNFLITAYRELRRLELDVVRAKRALLATGSPKDAAGVPRHLRGIDHALLDIRTELRVAVEQFHGIEILPWPCRLAQTGLWLMDHLMNMEASDELGEYYARLPLTQGAAIVEGNALRLDWNTVVPAAELSYIMGNPPFVGHQYRSAAQREDMELVYGGGGKHGKLDYVCCWYRKAADFMEGTSIRCAFVSTNSIVQGESVAALWMPLFDAGLEIGFAHAPFVWTNEAKGAAAVHCVIVGFRVGTGAKADGPKKIYGRGAAVETGNINGYLLPGPNVFVRSRGGPLQAGLPEMAKGSQPTDGGGLTLSQEERDELVSRHPQAEKWVRRYMGGDEFINGGRRWCLWLKGVAPQEYRRVEPIMQRLGRVAEARRASPTASVRRDADSPALFTQIRQPDTRYLAVPEVSSERRRYVPIGYLEPDVVASNKLQIVPDATHYMFGILTSSVHNAWTRVVCGRLKSDYSYSPAVYNNFPWPEADEGQKSKIAALAQGVLDARALFPNATLADLYDPLSMPPELLKAHRALDAAVMRLYGFAKDMSEPEIVAELMERYARLAGGAE